MNVRRAVKRRLLPRGTHARKMRGIARGITMHVDFETQTRLYLGVYEAELHRYVRDFCGNRANCFDVGASVGYYSLLLARLTGGRVAAFEGDPNAVAELEANLSLNPGLTDRIDVFPAKVGSRTDPAANVVALDDLVRHRETFVPDVIKIDTDGAEADVLAGARDLLMARRPHLIVEAHSLALEADSRALLEDAGYEIEVVDPRRLLPDYRPISHNRWLIGRGGDR
jgi:hypothetical protein